MKKLLLTAMIATLLLVPLQGVAMAETQEAVSPESAASQDSAFVPGEVPAQTDAVQSMTPAVHAMILAMFHHDLSQFDYSDPELGWETLYNMLSLYGQMDERSEYLDEQLILPAETAMDFSSAIFSSFVSLKDRTAISALAKMALSASMMNWISSKKPMESSKIKTSLSNVATL